MIFRRKVPFFLLIFGVVAFTIFSLWALEVADLPGRYELQGVMEMAGMIHLKPDKTYEAGFSYGAADWVEQGKWSAEGDQVVLMNSRFKLKNAPKLPLFLPAGTRFTYQQGRLTASGPGGQVVFINPHKTPSHRKTTGQPGEGRMLVKGRVVKLDSQSLVVKMGECLEFDVRGLSPEVLKEAQSSKNIEVEIPFSAMIGSSSCP